MRDLVQKYFVGAYAASPALAVWDPVAEQSYIEGLSRFPSIGGLELPFFKSLHRFDDRAFLKLLPPQWNFILNPIPGAMEDLKENSKQGLASTDRSSRMAALEKIRSALNVTQQLNTHFGKKVVLGVELHSTPKQTPEAKSSKEAFAESLAEIANWDWQGAKLCVEHCDAHVKTHVAEKGFLSLEDEIWACEKVGQSKVKLLINWGRSAVEGRNADTPLEHLKTCRSKGLLEGLIFSGTALEHPLYGNWADSHAPFETNLLTRARAVECMREFFNGDGSLFGLKMQALPKTMSVGDRIQFVQNQCTFLDSVIQESTRP